MKNHIHWLFEASYVPSKEKAHYRGYIGDQWENAGTSRVQSQNCFYLGSKKKQHIYGI